MDMAMQILGMIAFTIVVFIIYYVLKTFLLSKIKINKWAVLAVAIVFFIAPLFLWPTMPIFVSRYVIPGVFVIFALWFMDLSGFMKRRNISRSKYNNTGYKKDKKNDIVMRPKAKPNRVKNNKK
ncbi:hypothetical protein [Clostridium estertheticum]|uniref:DUF4491 family protein n=1 Tax=Clostridium estertheticum TaxID=238834 RepID=A0A7Y3SU92_9CLOT|nr:hypothetical protein [Clostridium estertheticum]MBX4264002.1 hypothetical protein [Clostridium estertheticum]MBX4268062.1 hypothetical protein [Clostridium estertheticum]NNU75474.1 hypothetical protein [Clostridium estertheticum]WBL46977.1 hypothetical protein LOR37_20465 [Clostridium estertheticum]WLC80002.1 hypothetical protein KTC98_01150 [Clostridium estertheticum]